MNVTDLLSTIAMEVPDAQAVITPDSSLSYRELDQSVSWTAAILRNAGLAQGDIAAIDLPNQLKHLISSLALARLGVGQFSFDLADPPQLRQQFIKRLNIVATVAEKSLTPAAHSPVISCPFGDIHELKTLGPVEVEATVDHTLPLLILRTSGTSSGAPKFGLLAHSTALPRIKSKGFALPEGQGTRYISLGSLTFNSVKTRALHCVLSGGCLALDAGTLEPQPLVDFIIEHGINYVSCSPDQALTLLDIAPEDEILLPGVKAFRVGSTFVAQPLRENIQRRITPNLYIAYGITEIGTVSIAPPAMVRHLPGVVGNLLPGLQAEAVDEDDSPLPSGMAGRLRLKSPGMIDRYLNAPKESEQAFRKGWFYSDDRVEFSRNGELIHHGRLDDMIIFDGVNINPMEIENALMRHSSVSESAAFSIEDDVHGDVPFAAIVIKCPVSQEKLLAYCADLLGPHSPQGLVIVPKLPRNAAGKVIKRELINLLGEKHRQCAEHQHS